MPYMDDGLSNIVAEGCGAGTFAVEPQGSVITNNDVGMIRAALQGVGLIQHIDIAVREHLTDGTLVRAFSEWRWEKEDEFPL